MRPTSLLPVRPRWPCRRDVREAAVASFRSSAATVLCSAGAPAIINNPAIIIIIIISTEDRTRGRCTVLRQRLHGHVAADQEKPLNLLIRSLVWSLG